MQQLILYDCKTHNGSLEFSCKFFSTKFYIMYISCIFYILQEVERQLLHMP